MRQFIYKGVPVKLNERTKQIKQSRFLKKIAEKECVANNNCNKRNNLKFLDRNTQKVSYGLVP